MPLLFNLSTYSLGTLQADETSKLQLTLDSVRTYFENLGIVFYAGSGTLTTRKFSGYTNGRSYFLLPYCHLSDIEVKIINDNDEVIRELTTKDYELSYSRHKPYPIVDLFLKKISIESDEYLEITSKFGIDSDNTDNFPELQNLILDTLQKSIADYRSQKSITSNNGNSIKSKDLGSVKLTYESQKEVFNIESYLDRSPILIQLGS